MSHAHTWAEEEFGAAELGDTRRRLRLIQLATRAAEQPGGTVTSVLRDEAEREGAFRFLGNASISVEAIAASAHQAALQRCEEEDFFYVAVDQTSLTFTDRMRNKGLGPAGKGVHPKARGLQVMTALAMTSKGQVQGVCGQSWWTRSDRRQGNPSKDHRPLEERESSLWTTVMQQVYEAVEQVGLTARPWLQMDRGADAFHVLEKAVDDDLWVTVRSVHDRQARTETGRLTHLRTPLKRLSPCAYLDHFLTPSAAKKAGHSPRRARHLAVRRCPVTLEVRPWSSSYDKPGRRLPFWLVHVREQRPPAGAERIEWFLLTTRPVHSDDDALEVVKGYTMRWRVEEFHRTWKSGACQVERSQLRNSSALKRWATLLASVAARIETLKHVARNEPDRPALEVATRDEVDAAILLCGKRKGKSLGDSLNVAEFVELVATAGGYTGMKSSGGPPGSITLRRGLERVLATAIGLAEGRKSKR